MGYLVSRYIDSPKIAQVLVLIFAGFFGFFYLGNQPISAWDEALHGELAMQMLITGDYINYSFGGQPEFWFSKPPLAIWAIAMSYKIFGFNEFALRFPSAIAIMGSFLFLFRMILPYKGSRFAFTVSMILISTNSLIGPHVGRAGDTDALLVFFLMAANYYFLKAVDHEKKLSWIWCGLAISFAFWVKGPAAFIVFMPWLVYLLLTRKLKSNFKVTGLWIGAAILIGSILCWVFLIMIFGEGLENERYGGDNTISTMIIYDIIKRFFTGPQGYYETDPFFLFKYLDSKFSVWVYLLYGLLLLSLFRKEISTVFKKDSIGNFSLFALLSWLPFSIFLMLAANRNGWYMAPVVPFIAIHLVSLIEFYRSKWPKLIFVPLIILIVTLVIKVNYFASPSSYHAALLSNEQYLKQAGKITWDRRCCFDDFLYMHFRNERTEIKYSIEPDDFESGDIFISSIARNNFKELELLGQTDDFFIYRMQ